MTQNYTLRPILLISPLVQLFSTVLKSEPNNAHFTAFVAMRNLRILAMEKDMLMFVP